MELQELITQLKEQADRKADPAQMILTIRLLEVELTRLSRLAAAEKASAKVAVMMPSAMKIYVGRAVAQEMEATSPYPSSTPAPALSATPAPAIPSTAAPALSATSVPAIPSAAATVLSEVEASHSDVQTTTIPAPPATTRKDPPPTLREKEPEIGPWPYDPLAEIPTITQQQAREINDVIGSNGSSLNDRLKSGRLELKSALNDTPVRDLKKAIGVNDRFIFISQLFRGDEAMYERSLKTINGFRILPEAEYWMERELKVKLGWDESREITRQFYQLVKRRFS